MSASAPSSRKTRRTRTRPSSPVTSTTERSPNTAPIQRSAGLQFRRRVQHRQPRPGRVRRGLKLDVAFPLRPARRDPGAQDQAEEVRADRHRRGDHRPHERGRVQEAHQQRVHGGASRPHDQDRHPVHHEDVGEEIKIYQKDFSSTRLRGKHVAPHTSRWRRCGPSSRASKSPRSISCPASEDEALRRQDPARVSPQDNVKELRKERTAKASTESVAAYTCRTRSATRSCAKAPRRSTSIRSWCSTSSKRDSVRQPSPSVRPTQALRRADRRREGRVRRDGQERSPAGDQRRRRGDRTAVRELRRQHSRLHAHEAEGEEQVHRQGRGAGRAPDAVDRREDRHHRELARTTSAARS